MKICIVSSCGGHLTEIRTLKEVYDQYENFYVLNDRISLPNDMRDKTYFIRHSERDWRFIINLFEGMRILFKEKPNIILSTGAGPIVPFSIVARLFSKAKIVYIETITRVNKPSLSGRFMYWLAHDFYYQWKPLGRYFPKANYSGPII